jgi:small subunit ribosomal protein S16
LRNLQRKKPRNRFLTEIQNMLSIKFKRIGKKHQPTYRIIVSERRSKLTGKYLEDLGWYNPHLKTFSLKEDRVKHWLSVGAKPSSTIHNLLVNKKVISAAKIPVHKKSKKEQEPKADISQEQAPAESTEQAPVESTEQAPVDEQAPAEPTSEPTAQAPAEPTSEQTNEEPRAEEPKVEDVKEEIKEEVKEEVQS